MVSLSAGRPARAGYLTGFSGNTAPASVFYPASGVAGVVDFTVLDRTTGGSAGDTFGTGVSNFNSLFTAGTTSGAFDTSARYLYLYETYNNGANGATYPISQNTVFVSQPGVSVTSYGSFKGAAFSTNVLGPQSTFTTVSPATVGSTPMIVTGNSGRAPELSLGTSSLLALYKFANFTELQAGEHSIIWGFTSNVAPIFATTSIQDGGTSGTGTAPTTTFVPEPSAFLSLALGLPALVLVLRRLGSKG
jgi:hypothetical protein